MIAKPALLSLAIAGLILGASGCGSDSETASPKSSASSADSTESPSSGGESSEATGTAVITIKDFKFQGPESVAPGTEITVVNEDDAAHTVTAEGDGGFDVSMEAGETVKFTAPSEPGEYPYICTVHPGMKGSLVVA